MKTFTLLIAMVLLTHFGLFAQSSNNVYSSTSVKTGETRMSVSSGAVLTVTGTLTIDPGGKLIVNPGGGLTVSEALINNSIATDLVIESGGSLITEGSVSGQAIIKRTITANLGWHMLSSPVSYQEICDGTFAPILANFSTTPSTSFDFYKWNENELCIPFCWRNLRSTDLSANTIDFGSPPQFVVKSGYLVAYSSYFPSYKIFTGTPNTGDQTFSLTIRPSSSLLNWNLIGNPYPSAVDWDNVTGKSNLVNGYYYVYNINKIGGAGYEGYLDATHKTSGVSGKIPAMQAFFVNALGTSIGIPNLARTHESDNWLKSAESITPDKLTFTLSNATNYDEAYVLFESNGKIGSDWYDATKMLSLDLQIPQIYTMASVDQKTLINSMPYINNPITIPVGIVAPADGNYSIKVTGIENVTSLTGLSLEDLTLHHTQNLLQNPVYHFTASGNEDASRFLLHFNGDITNSDNNPIKIYSSEKTISVFCFTGLQNGQITVSNMIGQQILIQKMIDQPLNQVRINAVKGYYIVKVRSDNAVKTAKVYIN